MKLLPHFLFMADVFLERAKRVLLKKDAAEAEIGPLIAEEPRTLLNRILVDLEQSKQARHGLHVNPQ